MKSYPSIPHYNKISRRNREHLHKGPWYVFDKIDGSCIRAEWSNKSCFYKFGTSGHLIDASTPVFGEAIDLILGGYEHILEEEFPEIEIDRAVVFFEFFGEHSFAGSHVEEPHEVRLIDINVYKRGFVDPIVLQDLQEVIPCAGLLAKEPFSEAILEEVGDSVLLGMTFEGVVFKQGSGDKRIMFKHKSKAWFDKLAEVCGDNKARFEELR